MSVNTVTYTSPTAPSPHSSPPAPNPSPHPSPPAPKTSPDPYKCPRPSPSYIPVPLQYHSITPTRRLAYRHHVGLHQPTIMYVPGFMSPMSLNKVVVLEQYARNNGYSSLRYDQECTGESTGDQATVEFEHWLEDVLVLMDTYTKGHVILVASSLGCWISTLVALRRPNRIQGMIFLGPGFNVMWTGYWFHYNQLSNELKAKADAEDGVIKIKMKYGGWGILRKDFCERTRKFEIDFEQPVNVTCPVRIMHGINDTDVPHEFCHMLMDKLVTEDVEVTYRKAGDHRLMTSRDLHLLTYELDRLIKHCTALEEGMVAGQPLLSKL